MARVEQLGRNGDSVKVLPDVSPSITGNLPTASPELNYKIYFFSTGTFPVTVYRIPSLNTTGACRLAIGLDSASTTDPHGRAFDRRVQVEQQRLGADREAFRDHPSVRPGVSHIEAMESGPVDRH